MVKFIVGLINLIISALGSVLNFIFGFLPPSPFKLLSNSPIADFLGTLNYMFPIAEIISIGELWLTCVGLYYIYQIVLRWIKAIE